MITLAVQGRNLAINHIKITKKSKMLEKRTPILEPFWVMFQSKNESKKRLLSFGIDFQWIWRDFGVHFDAILIHFRLDFLLWRTMRFR